MENAEQRDIERAALAAYLHERGLSGTDAVALMVNTAGEILGAALAGGKLDTACTQVLVERLAAHMRRSAGVDDRQDRAH